MAQAKPKAKAKPAKAPPLKTGADVAAEQANGNGNGNGKRARLAIPEVGTNEKVTHDTLYTPDVLAEYDEVDRTRIDRANAILEEGAYEGEITGWVLRKLQPLLREPINPRHIITTGPADKGKPITTTGIRSVQVQIDRLSEVVGADHFRILPFHTPDGVRCRVHVVIGNDLQWCRLDNDGNLIPYTNLDDGGTATLFKADVIAHEEGWGGHARGSAPGDVWKGSFTNAAKLAIARIGPGNHVYLLDFEDDPHAPEARGINRGGGGGSRRAAGAKDAPQAPPVGDVPDPEAAIAQLLAADEKLRPLREDAITAMGALGAQPRRQLVTLTENMTETALKDLNRRLNSMIDEASEAQASLDVGGTS